MELKVAEEELPSDAGGGAGKRVAADELCPSNEAGHRPEQLIRSSSGLSTLPQRIKVHMPKTIAWRRQRGGASATDEFVLSARQLPESWHGEALPPLTSST